MIILMNESNELKHKSDKLVNDILVLISSTRESQCPRRLPDKWDVLAAIFIAATVSASVVGIAWCASYIITSYLTTTMIVSAVTSILSSETKMKMVSKLQHFIQTKMIWLLAQSGTKISEIEKIHYKTKSFLIDHFGTLEEFEMFLLEKH
jgi:hypothetical protein